MTSSAQTLEATYQKKTERQHVLDNPDTYTGSMDMVDTASYVYDDISNKIILKELNDVISGLYKLFDEGIVNCRDHSVRMRHAMKMCKPNTIPTTYIDVSISDR